MINFRYHVVSLTAVFLALAIGLVVGTAALNGPLADSLSDNVNALRKNNEQLRESLQNLEEEVNRKEDFVAEAAQWLLADKLTGRRFLVLTLPSGRDHAEGVTGMLRMAGATVTGQVDMQDKFTDPDNSIELLELAERAARPTVPTNGLPGNSLGVEKSSALLASVLLDRADGLSVADADRRAVLGIYGDAGYLSASDQIAGPAEAVVVVSGAPYVDRDAAKKDQSVVTMVEQFDQAGVTVVAGRGSGTGNLVAAVRDDPTLIKTISTVDNANTLMGQVATVLAGHQQIVEKRAGQYGLGEGATLLPQQPE